MLVKTSIYLSLKKNSLFTLAVKQLLFSRKHVYTVVHYKIQILLFNERCFTLLLFNERCFTLLSFNERYFLSPIVA